MSAALTRQQLYDRVWAAPMTQVAAELGLSGGGLAKICDRLLIPYPPRGHWARAKAGAAAGVDYLAFGAVYPSPTKPHAPRAGLDLLRRAKAELGLPVAAIGGITLDNAPSLITAGADLPAVISDVFSAPDPAARAAAYAGLFD